MIERALERALERSIEKAVERAASAPPYVGPLDLVPGAVVALDQWAASAAKLGTALYTIRSDLEDTETTYNSDGTTGTPPILTISSAAPTFNRIGATDDGNTEIVLTSAANVKVGQMLTGAGIEFGAIVTDISSAPTISIFPAPTATNAAASLTFYPSRIKSWTNQGAVNPVIQETADLQPVWIASASGSQPGILFNGNQGGKLVSQSDVTLSSSSYTEFLVLKVGNFAGATTVNIPGNADWAVGVANDSISVFSQGGSDGNGFFADGDTSSYCVIDAAWGPEAANSYFVNGVPQECFDDSYGTGIPGPLSAPMTIGDGPTRCVIVAKYTWNSILSNGDRLAIRQLFATRYGITLP